MDPLRMTDLQHLWWQILSKIDWWPIQTWPEWAQVLAMKAKKSDSNMYNLMYFLSAENDMDPYGAARIVLAVGARGGGPGGFQLTSDWPYGPVEDILRTNRPGVVYSAKEIRDTARVVKKALDGQLYDPRKRVYNMIASRPLSEKRVNT